MKVKTIGNSWKDELLGLTVEVLGITETEYEVSFENRTRSYYPKKDFKVISAESSSFPPAPSLADWIIVGTKGDLHYYKDEKEELQILPYSPQNMCQVFVDGKRRVRSTEYIQKQDFIQDAYGDLFYVLSDSKLRPFRDKDQKLSSRHICEVVEINKLFNQITQLKENHND